MNADHILELRGIGHNFGGFRALDQVDIAVPRGTIYGLMGPNGSGKTTLFNVATGYVQPTNGEVVFNGRALNACSVKARSAAGLVRTFQTPKVFDGMTVLQNVMVGCTKLVRTGILQDIFRAPHATRQLDEIRRRAEAICADFDLTRLQDRPADKLTAGQRRTVELARALASEPELLLLDEPSSGLSTEETARLEQCIRTLQTKGVSVLLVSHDMGLMGVAQTVSVLYFGKIIAHGSMEEIRRHERVRQVYLGGEKC